MLGKRVLLDESQSPEAGLSLSPLVKEEVDVWCMGLGR
jgi:hypothetical protein